jgi:acetate kinase
MKMKVLVINAGSSSIKYQLIDMTNENLLAKGQCDRIGIDGGNFKQKNSNGVEYKVDVDIPDHAAGIKLVKKTGDKVDKGDTIAILYTSDNSRLEAAKKRLIESTIIGDAKPTEEPLILDIVE